LSENLHAHLILAELLRVMMEANCHKEKKIVNRG